MQTALVIDRRDNLARLRGYVLLSTCRNCAEKHASLFSIGQEAIPAQTDQRCPYCGCDGKLYFGSMKDGFALATQEGCEVQFDDPLAGFVPLPRQQAPCVIAPLAFSPPTVFATQNAKVYDAP